MNEQSNQKKDESFVAKFEGESLPSEAVMKAVAMVEDTPPWNLQPPLYDALDPDALDSLLTGKSTPNRVVFVYLGHDVTVKCDGHVIVE